MKSRNSTLAGRSDGHLKTDLRVGLTLPAGYADLQAQPHPQRSSNSHHERERYRGPYWASRVKIHAATN